MADQNQGISGAESTRVPRQTFPFKLNGEFTGLTACKLVTSKVRYGKAMTSLEETHIMSPTRILSIKCGCYFASYCSGSSIITSLVICMGSVSRHHLREITCPRSVCNVIQTCIFGCLAAYGVLEKGKLFGRGPRKTTHLRQGCCINIVLLCGVKGGRSKRKCINEIVRCDAYPLGVIHSRSLLSLGSSLAPSTL